MLSLMLLLALAQTPTPAQADSLYFDGQPERALELIRTGLVHAPADSALLWRAARATIAIAWLEPDEDVSVAGYREGQRFAREALRTWPDHVNSMFWLAVGLGREAQVRGGARTVARLAGEAHVLAARVLAAEPDHAGAHNLLGQMHLEAMSTPWAVREIVLRLIGARIPFDASWEQAERFLERAVALDERGIVNHLELGRLYLRRDRKADARVHLQRALALPVVHPPDPYFQQQARELLRAAR